MAGTAEEISFNHPRIKFEGKTRFFVKPADACIGNKFENGRNWMSL